MSARWRGAAARPPQQDQRSRAVITTAAATAVSIVSVMPAFLSGASSALLGDDLGIAPTETGLAIGVFFAASAIAAPLGGRLAEAWGPTRTLVQVTFASAALLLGIGAFVSSLAALVAAMAIGGLINGLAQPATVLALARGVVRRQALTFGVKQSAIPLATLLAGATVPLLGVDYGWRWAFFVAALAALICARLPLTIHATSKGQRVAGGVGLHLSLSRAIPLAVVMGIGTAAATAIAVYLVPTAVAMGVSVAMAGWLLVAGSVAGVVTRLAGGWFADRRGGDALDIIALMLLLGSFGYAMVSLQRIPWLIAGTILAYSCGWGWGGLVNYVTVRLNPSAPAAAAGIVQTGGAAGAAAGPIAFGQVIEQGSYSAAWLASCAGLVFSSGLVVLVRAYVNRTRSNETVAPPA